MTEPKAASGQDGTSLGSGTECAAGVTTSAEIATVRMHAVIVVNLPTVTRDEYEWALDQIERAATGSWAPDIDRHVHGALDEAVVDRVVTAFFPQPGEADSG